MLKINYQSSVFNIRNIVKNHTIETFVYLFNLLKKTVIIWALVFFRRILMKKKGFFQRSLDRVEFVGNKLPHAVTLFALLAFLLLILFAVISSVNIEVEHTGSESEIVSVTNLLTNEGSAYIFTSMTENFIGFAPLGVVLVTMLGIGLAETTGLISAVLRGFVLSVPQK